MSIENTLQQRSGGKCELCSVENKLLVYTVPPELDAKADNSLLLCEVCRSQIENSEQMNVHHWHCLNDSMWSEVPAVQVMAWRMLHRIKAEGWPQDLLDMLYLDEGTLKWAAATGEGLSEEDVVLHRDANGAQLSAGDTVTLIKDLKVKGGNFTAKQGTAVRGISLVRDNAAQIEGKVSGQQIVILTQYVKKSS